jgi:signal transduction histidine kinase
VVGTSKAEDWVELFVRDTGAGFTPETRARIFESFFSTKTHGLGLGLTIARSIVERYRGRVMAENSPAGGAVFRVILPATSGGVHTPAGSRTHEAVAL